MESIEKQDFEKKQVVYASPMEVLPGFSLENRQLLCVTQVMCQTAEYTNHGL